ncbi:MAG: oxidoreductase [Gemmatimonadota bacterium]|nr:oxidoreductase [Gemmatimonadota bacterium]MDH4351015.1 oxidoreductase [Gemmatimonadota bacterium]
MTAPCACTALVVGATGLVGAELVRQLAAHPGWIHVSALVRRVPDRIPDTVTPILTDFERLDRISVRLAADHVFCALGTTIRAAGSQAAFRHVDHDYVVGIARLAREVGARHFLLVSSLGATPRSRVFYSRVKGEVEQAIQALGYPSVTIVRPSLLLGDRAEFRLGEVLMKPLGPLMPRRLRPVHAHAVAATLIRAAGADAPGVRIVESAEITD